MGVKKYKPTTPGQRGMTGYTFEEITKSTPESTLLLPLRKRGGRNLYGKITVRHQGGGNRRHIRIVDFKRDKRGIPAKVAAIEYDPNRSARLALLHYVDGEKRYIVAPLDLRVGDTVLAGNTAEIRPGNSLPIANIPVGTLVHNIELKVGRGGQLVRAAGAAAQLLAKEGDFAQIRMPSGEVRRSALQPSVRWAMLSTVISSSAKRVASAISASVPRCAARRCPRVTIRMAAARVASPSVWLDRKARGESPHLAIRPGATRRRINISCAGVVRSASPAG